MPHHPPPLIHHHARLNVPLTPRPLCHLRRSPLHFIVVHNTILQNLPCLPIRTLPPLWRSNSPGQLQPRHGPDPRGRQMVFTGIQAVHQKPSFDAPPSLGGGHPQQPGQSVCRTNTQLSKFCSCSTLSQLIHDDWHCPRPRSAATSPRKQGPPPRHPLPR